MGHTAEFIKKINKLFTKENDSFKRIIHTIWVT